MTIAVERGDHERGIDNYGIVKGTLKTIQLKSKKE
jgi:hypothetical protein